MLISFAVLALASTQAEPDAAGELLFEDCVYTRAADRDPGCAPVLEEAAAPVPASFLQAAPGRGPGSNPWVEQTCARENLQAGQTTYACRQEADAVFARARLAYRALNGLPNYGGLRAAADAEAVRRADVAGPEQPEPNDRERCRRTGSSWRDDDTGESEADYRITCSWSSDPDGDGEASRALNEFLSGD